MITHVLSIYKCDISVLMWCVGLNSAINNNMLDADDHVYRNNDTILIML